MWGLQSRVEHLEQRIALLRRGLLMITALHPLPQDIEILAQRTVDEDTASEQRFRQEPI